MEFFLIQANDNSSTFHLVLLFKYAKNKGIFHYACFYVWCQFFFDVSVSDLLLKEACKGLPLRLLDSPSLKGLWHEAFDRGLTGYGPSLLESRSVSLSSLTSLLKVTEKKKVFGERIK